MQKSQIPTIHITLSRNLMFVLQKLYALIIIMIILLIINIIIVISESLTFGGIN